MRRHKPKETLAELGLKLILIGGALLLVPVLVGSHPVLVGFKSVLRFPGAVLLSIGLLVMALHLWRSKRATPQPVAASKAPPRAASSRNTPGTYNHAAVRRILKTDDHGEPTLAPAALDATPPPSPPPPPTNA